MNTARRTFAQGLVLCIIFALTACGGGGGGTATGGGAPVDAVGSTPPAAAPSSPDPSSPPASQGSAPVSVSLFAGASRTAGSADGVGVQARFNQPVGVAQDSTGNVYVADTGNHVIRKIAPDLTVTTFAGVAGQPGSTDGRGAAARFLSPEGVAVDSAGVVYVADTGNHMVRRIGPDAVVSTVAGVAGQSANVDGNRATARLYFPRSIAVDATGILYVSTSSDLKKVTPDGVVSTFASTSSFFFGFVAVDGAGNVYVAESGSDFNPLLSNGTAVYKIDAQGKLAKFGQSSSQVVVPSSGIATDPSGNVYVTSNREVVKIAPDGATVKLAGNASENRTFDGPGAVARFRNARGISVGPGGRIVLTEPVSGAIRQIDAQGVVSTLAGGEGDGNADGQTGAARFSFPRGLVAAPDGTLLVGDVQNNTVRRITAAGLVSTLPTAFSAKAGGSSSTSYVALDAQGTLYVTGSNILGSNPVYAVSAAGQLRVLAQLTEVTTSLAAGPGGKLYVGTQGAIAVINADGSQGTKITGLGCTETSMAVSGALLYVSCAGQHTVRSIDGQGRVAVVAGKAGEAGSSDGQGGQARLDTPQALALDAVGNLYIADAGTIRRMTPDGDVRTIAVTVSPAVPGRVTGLAWSAGMLYATLPHAVLKVGPVN